MNYLVYLIYPILIITLLWGSKLARRGYWNDEAFSLRQMKAMQGFIAILIMMHHCGQKRSASWIDRRYYVPGLEFFVPIGFILVAFFTFCSGYGLYKSFKAKENYLSNKFIVKRILPIVILAYVVNWIYYPIRVLLGEKMTPQMTLAYLSGAKLCNPYGWYVIVIPFFYLCFFLAFRFIKNEKIALLAVLLFTVAYQVLGASIDHNDWWMRGEWWYNSIHLFVVGIFFAMHEETIVAHLKKFYILYLILGLVAIFVFTGYRAFASAVFSYYGETWDAPFKVLRRLATLSSEILLSSAVVFETFMVGLKLRIGNRFLDLMGKITLEFYLIHGLFSELFNYNFDGKARSLYYIRNSFYFVVVVFVLGLVSALILSAFKRTSRISASKRDKASERSSSGTP